MNGKEVFVVKEQADARTQFARMVETPIPRLILSLAGPTVLSMLITSIYNLADTFFVGQLSTSASGAVGVVSSLMAIIQALGFMLVGFGISSIVPVCYSLSSHSKAFPVGVAIAAVSTVGFLGFLFGPPVIGHAADFFGKIFAGTPEEEASVGLRGAFFCAALFSLLSAAIAPKLKKYVGDGATAFFGEK